ncbi:MAG: LamG domain-containing protein [Methylococcales bacterium]|nr:LamG domain-containing protein [Methylococcales bacterium]
MKIHSLLIITAVGLVLSGNALADLQSGLVAYYPFNGNANDESGNANNPTVNNSVLTTDRLENAESAYQFENSVISTPTSNSISPTSSVSISAWVYPDHKAEWHPIMTKRFSESESPFNSYILDSSSSNSSNNKWRFCLSNNSRNSQACTADNEDLKTNSWTQVTGVYTGSYIKLYVNGLLKSSLSKTGAIGYTSLPLRIGQTEASGGQGFNGKIDEVKIYNRALSDCEVKALYDGTGTCQDVVTTTPSTTQEPTTCEPQVTTVVDKSLQGTVSTSLDIHVPSMNYQSPNGVLNIWADFTFQGKNNNDFTWKLKDFGEN